MSFGVIKRARYDTAYDFEKITNAIEKAFQSTDFYNHLCENDRKNYYNYLRIMAKLGWPAYINGNSFFHSTIIDLYDAGNITELEDTIYNYYGALYLKELEEQFSVSSVIKKERLPLFHEAFLLHQLGYYYGTVAILVAQIIGITADIEEFLKRNNATYDQETLALIENFLGYTERKDIFRVMAAVTEGKSIDDEQQEYGFLLGYLRYKIFGSDMSKSDTEHHVNRNRLYHGAQLNYGTKEHSLKVILCVEALAWIAELIANNATKDT